MAEAGICEIDDRPRAQAKTRAQSGALQTAAVLLLIMFLGVAVRVVIWAWFQNVPIAIDDEKDYDKLARNLVEHGEFSFYPGTLTSLRPPLYPAMVAGIYAVFGVGNLQAVRVVQALLSLLNVLVVYGLGKEIASRRTALWLAGLFCFYPSLLGFNNLLLTETLFTLLLSTFCYLTVLAYQRECLGWLMLAGATLGLAALARSIMWIFPPLLALFLLVTWNASWSRRLLAVIAATMPFVAVIAPWSVRNSVLQETFVAVDSMGGRNFFMGNYEHTPLYRSWDAIAFTDERAWYNSLKALPSEDRSTQGKLDKVAFKEGVKFVSENPMLTLQRDIIKFFDFWGLERELIAGAGRGIFGPVSKLGLSALVVVIVGSYVALLFLGIFGLFLVPVADWRMKAFLLLVVVYICGLHTLVFAHSRYHLPLMPIVLLFAALAITNREVLRSKRWTAPFWAAAGLCGVMIGGWMWGLAAGDWDRISETLIAFI